MPKPTIMLAIVAVTAVFVSTGEAYDLQVVPTTLTNNVMAGFPPSNQYFIVTNAATGTFDYSATFTSDWINACTPSNGTLGSFANDVITVAYSNSISSWPAGTASNTTIMIASTNAPGATQTVAVAMNVVAQPMLILDPLSVTQTV